VKSAPNENPSSAPVVCGVSVKKRLPMTEKEFLNAVSNGKIDVLKIFLDALSAVSADYCVIGGLAVNAYTDDPASI